MGSSAPPAGTPTYPTRAGHADGLVHRLPGAGGLQHRVRADSAQQADDLRHAVGAPLGHDVGRAELAGEALPLRMPGHDDDPLGTQPPRRQYTAQADRAVADDCHRGLRADPGRERRMMAGAHHIRQREQARDQRLGRPPWNDHEHAVGERHPDRLALGSVDPPGRILAAPPCVLYTRGVDAVAAMRAHAVGDGEGRDDEIAGPHGPYLASRLLDDADELVPDPRRRVADTGDSPVRPQIRPAHTGGHHAYHGIRRQPDHRIGHVLQTDVPRTMDDRRSHGPTPFCPSSWPMTSPGLPRPAPYGANSVRPA
jgi:hypothetical protein